jgi:hypothetical protein
MLCIDRSDTQFTVFQPRKVPLKPSPVASWPSFEQWITTQIERLSFMFDETGRLLVDKSKTLPIGIRLA